MAASEGDATHTVTKKELIDLIADETGQKRTDVKQTIQLFLTHIVDQLEAGNRLEFRDFGVFEVKTRAARRAQNPKTLEPVMVPEKKTVKFKPGRKMREIGEGTGDASAASSMVEAKNPAGVESEA